MKSFPLELATLMTVIAGVLDDQGVLLEANAGLLRIVPNDIAGAIGSNLARIFVQPSFASLLESATHDGQQGYRGLMTIGDRLGRTRSLRGRVWRTPTGIRLLAEYDIADLEKLTDSLQDLNRDSIDNQHALARANLALKQREVRIVESSLTDALTGVGNRRQLEQALVVEVGRSRRSGARLSVIMADIDHFKRINDEHGHGTGDQVLARFGALLKSLTRPTDVVTRYGGEEFVVLMPETGLIQAMSKAEQIRASIAAESLAPLARSVTSSFGVAELLIDEDGATLINRADVALYRAKEGGRNRVVAADSEPRALASSHRQ